MPTRIGVTIVAGNSVSNIARVFAPDVGHASRKSGAASMLPWTAEYWPVND